ncbi:BatD family protein [Hydrogenimonas urashimensis]|uniref:BatD family protein n=1 Tax=Hydrogenimonas urashimensis TaxID=2740515 RepID=UPI0019155520|nr:BatD family protein [Hydrogenimonas urashimensis]
MRRHPGKRLLWALLFVPLFLAAAGIKMHVDRKEVTRGDTVTFSITAEGEDVAFPVLKEIDGFPILGTSQRSNISIINGHTSRSVTKSYTFAPMRDVTIPSLEVKVDGTLYRTDPVRISVSDAPKPGTRKGDARLEIDIDKKRVHVGEPVTFDVVIRYRRDARFAQVDLQSPEFPNFWIKKVGEVQKSYEGEYIVEKQRYLIFPQKAGSFKLGPLTAKIAKRVRVKPPINDPFFDDDFFNGFFARLEWSRIASNAVTIQVDPLPGNVELYGDFTIRASVDRQRVEANQPVRVTIEIEGEGNIDDIKKFEPHIPDTVVYSDDPVVKERITEGRYGGTFKETVTIVSDHDFTIPSFVLRYYDKERQQVIEKRTEPIPIKVVGGKKNADVKDLGRPPEKTEKVPSATTAGKEGRSLKGQEKEEEYRWLYLLVGIVLGAAGAWWLGNRKLPVFMKKREFDIARAIRHAKNDRELLDLLLPYAQEDERIKEALERLEENIYKGKRDKIDRKILAEIVEDIEEERM